ncbi:MAG: hypothetical protein L3K19_05290 [Thermoplasmata archaeon]|nr:hypothetical protein [Thermoplasmata archaeon]
MQDRYIPNPTRFHWGRVRFVLARPYADQSSELLDSWSREEGAVVVWGSAQVALGVFFHTDLDAAEEAEQRLKSHGHAAWSTTWCADPGGESIPVYFDFEGSWAHLSGAAGSLGYPHGLGGPHPADGEIRDRSATTADPRRAWAAAELLHRPFVPEGGIRSPHLVGPFGLPWSQQRLLASGWVTHRVLLYPAKVPPFSGRTTDQVLWIVGRLRGQATADQLFARLTRDCRVYPFLFVDQGGVLLMGALGKGGASASSSESAGTEPRRPVMPTLKESLEGIEIIQEASAQMQTVVDHRYDRLLERRHS